LLINTVNDFEEFIKEEYKNLIFSLNDNITSIFVIGSMVNKKKKLPKYGDYDLRIILKYINKKHFSLIEKFVKVISLKLIKNGIDCNYSFIIGPARHITKSDRNMMIHCIVMGIEALDNLPLTHKYSYSQNYRILHGEDLLKKYKDTRFDGNDVINCVEGINYCIDMINTKNFLYKEWKFDKNIEIVERQCKMDEKTFYEVLRYSITKATYNINNMIKWKGIDTPDRFNDILPIILKENFDKKIISDINSVVEGSFENFEKNKEYYTDIIKHVLNYEIKYINEEKL
jgi:hypothetical protein